jgi:hypothetical protein
VFLLDNNIIAALAGIAAGKLGTSSRDGTEDALSPSAHQH